MDYSLSIIWQSIVLIILIFLSAYFSAFEAAISSLNKFQLESYYKKKKNEKGYKSILYLLDNFQMTISTILAGNNLVAVATATVSTLFFTNICLNYGVSNAESMAVGLSTGIVTVLLLIFGEFLPKSFARKHNILFLIKTYYIGLFFYFLFWPISWCLNLVIRKNKDNSITEDDLHSLVNVINKEGVLGSREANLVKNAIRFDDTKVMQIMKKENLIEVIHLGMKKNVIAKKFINKQYSRLPVVKNNKYIGLLTSKSFFYNLYLHGNKFDIESLIQPIISVSQYTTLDLLLQKMQVNQCHMAIIKKTNDSSKIVGFVTLENVLEYLVGDIFDEHDGKRHVAKINDFTYRVDESTKASVFFDEYFSISIDFSGTMGEWIKHEFNIKKIKKNTKRENSLWKISTEYNRKQNNYLIIIEKK